jgi:hypothetical protein
MNVGINFKLKILFTLERTNYTVTHSISVDVVPSVRIPSWWPNGIPRFDRLLMGIRGCFLTFDQPQRKCPWTPWCQPCARVDFTMVETGIIHESPAVVRAAFIVVKQMTKHFCDYVFFKSFVTKSALMHCIQDRDPELNRCFAESFDDIEKEQLLRWTAKITDRLLCFVMQDFVPSAFFPNFTLPVCTFELHLKFMRIRLHQLGLTFEDLIMQDLSKYKDMQLLLILKTFICVHLMYYCLMPVETDSHLYFPTVNPITEVPFSVA